MHLSPSTNANFDTSPRTKYKRAATRLVLRQLGDIRRDPARLILGKQFRRRSTARLILEIDTGKLLSVVVAHDIAGVLFFD